MPEHLWPLKSTDQSESSLITNSCQHPNICLRSFVSNRQVCSLYSLPSTGYWIAWFNIVSFLNLLRLPSSKLSMECTMEVFRISCNSHEGVWNVSNSQEKINKFRIYKMRCNVVPNSAWALISDWTDSKGIREKRANPFMRNFPCNIKKSIFILYSGFGEI